ARPRRRAQAVRADPDPQRSRVSWTREQMVRRAAAEVLPGQIVNLGIGMPTELAILGGLEVACNGDLANWTVPGRLITGMGGAMDLAAGARRLVVLQNHT